MKWTAASLAQLPPQVRQSALASLTAAERGALAYSWEFVARPEQLQPEGDWTYWLIMAGRGYGKTRTGAETARRWNKDGIRYINLIGATADDARDVMVQGESGILAICPPWDRPEYKPSQRKLVWPNGAESLIFTADEPERLRGKQHERLWCDEIAAWRYPESWDQAKFGLRLGRPRAVITTTPRPTKLVRDLIADSATHVTRGRTQDNASNLAQAFFDAILKRYEGTRLGRQEIDGEILDDNPGALFRRADIDAGRKREAPTLTRVVVAIDPAVTSNEDSDETGIVVAGVDALGEPHVLADLSERNTPDGWARTAVKAYHEYTADRIVAETNNGGEMVGSVIRSVDRNVSFRAVTASRGKAIRAEPVAALYEQHKVHHVGSFPALEDQQCEWNPADASAKSPDRMDALVWAITELCLTETNTGMLDYYRQEAERIKAMSTHA